MKLEDQLRHERRC